MGRWRRWLLAALALQFAALAVREAVVDGPTVDEAFDVAAGLTAVVHQDARFLPEHGLLPRAAAAVPALLADPVVPRGPGYRSGDWFQLTEDFVVANDHVGRYDDVVTYARLVPVALAVLTGFGIARLASSLFGPDAGLVAGAAWFTLPLLVGLGHLATTDVPFAAATVAVSLAVLGFLRRPDDRRAALLGLAVGAALLTRHLGLVLAATSVVTVAAAGPPGWQRRLRHAALCGVVALASVWALHRAVDPGGGGDDLLAGIIADARADGVLARLVLAVPWPQEWAAGFGYLVLTSEPRAAYLLGEAWTGGRWWFFPGSLLVKVPATALAAMAAGAVMVVARAGGHRRQALVACGVPAAALAVALVAQPLNLGLRYAVPVLALGLVLVSPVARLLRHRGGAVALGAVLAVQVASLWAATPHSIAWTAPPFTPGYRWAADSNLDYGQDLFRLREWEHVEGARVEVLAPRGLGRPDGSLPLAGVDPGRIDGWVAAGATALTVTQREELAWLRAYCPVGTIGGSILLWYFDEAPTAEAGPTMPAPPCTGDVSVRVGDR